ncbi:GH25 family lysozyme [Sphingomonas mucosissima]|uniref:Lysozyme M1 n=1 Tax=Sphingomonas mucosissima TaxID=370959 RepID=A0A245ZEN2_9SPHN|nr:GH25 family lysozyme [Sphingomonas mucosissima]OWK28210.1 lysozyme M1 precursor [Sphingomonas mucosissima]
MFSARRFLLIIAVLAVLGAFAWREAVRWRPASETFAVQGVDVGEANGPVEWKVVAGAGADFAYANATYGARRRDRRFEENWQNMAAAGLRRGAVHVWSLCEPGVDQANAFNTMVPREDDALPVVIDFDYAEGCGTRPERQALIDDVKHAATLIEAHTGKPVLLRVSRAFEDDYELSGAVPRPIWATGNFFKPYYAARPWRMWRASNIHRIDGIVGPVNWNVAAS